MCGRCVGDLNAGPGNVTGPGKSCGWNAAHGGFRCTWAAAVTPFPVMAAQTAAHASNAHLSGLSYVAGAQLVGAAKDLAAWLSAITKFPAVAR